MQKYYLHNYKVSLDVNEKKKTTILQKKQPINVDINRLLNRVKIEKKNKIKEKFSLFMLSSLTVGITGIFIFLAR
tara:strand:+ start:862 stop:1086 length:225 start_codon:yes stop_codon:yes gene_type:complete